MPDRSLSKFTLKHIFKMTYIKESAPKSAVDSGLPQALKGSFLKKIPATVSLSVASLLSVNCLFVPSSQAAVFAESSGDFSFSNFSESPLATDASVFISTLTAGSGATAIATADSLFESVPTAQAQNVISNSAVISSGPGSALAQSDASVIGLFAIAPNSLFSFDFSGTLDLLTITEQPTETASAALETRYALFDDTDPDNVIALDFLSLFGQLNTPSGLDDFEISRSSDAVTLTDDFVANSFGNADAAEFLSIEVAGSYERFFETPASLTLVELKQGVAFAGSQAPVDIPESSSPLVWLVGVAGAIMLSRRNCAAPRFTY